MRILTRYILKEIVSHSLLGLLVFTFVLFVRHLGQLLEMVARHTLDVSSLLTLFLLPVPGILILTVPMAVLVGILIGLSRMAADGEVIAARAVGVGTRKFLWPVMLLALTGWALASLMSLYLAPRAARQLHRMEIELKSRELPHEIQPRVFIEQFPNLLIYVQDVAGTRSEWRGIFIADLADRAAPNVTLAERGVLVNDAASGRLLLHLENGTTHETEPERPERYTVVSFTETTIPIPLERGAGAAAERRTPVRMTVRDLMQNLKVPDERRAAMVELHYRFALPVASLVLALVGVPLGLATRKGGKALGLIMTVGLVFLYYILMAFGLSFAKQGRIDPALGLWIANVVFAAGGLYLLKEQRRLRLPVQFVAHAADSLVERWQAAIERFRKPKTGAAQAEQLHPRRMGGRFLSILDLYILREWFFYLLLLLVTFVGIYLIFEFFQLLGDIVRHQVPFTVVLNYFRYVTPQVAYLMLPLSVLVATLVSFGLLTKSNQMTAILSSGVSVYRAAAPVISMAALLSVGLFLLENNYLPQTNQRQDALRNQIKGRPPQTVLRPDRQWIFGESNRLYNYRFFDPDQNVFAHLTVFEFDPETFRLKRRVFATRAFWEPPLGAWVLENGWVRDLEGDAVRHYMPFSIASFDQLREDPGYFLKEVKASAQMNAFELREYIQELSQGGFDVVRLTVQYYRKFSFPLVAVIVTLIGIPFALTVGARGAISGVAISIGIAILYWSSASLFGALGNLHQLPPLVAAWSPDALFGLAGIYLLLRVRT
jgi:LPS export ABC transporter permease LptF/LPS export ABC transporter permease LptG